MRSSSRRRGCRSMSPARLTLPIPPPAARLGPTWFTRPARTAETVTWPTVSMQRRTPFRLRTSTSMATRAATFCMGRACALGAQTRYDLLLKGGHLIDPKNRIDRVMDVAVSNGKIARVAENIPASAAAKTIDVARLYVTPGLIDLHAHLLIRPHGPT